MNAPPVGQALWDAIAAVLPTPRQTLFLRACLYEGPAALHAWDTWIREATRDGTPLVRALTPVNALLPLLLANLERNGATLDRHLATHLRAARLTEELRWNTYRGICGEAFGALELEGIPFVVIKGAALSELVYPVPLLRHSHDIDVLLHAADLARAAALLVRLGWRRSNPPLENPVHAPAIVHPSGVAIELHRRLLIPYYTLPDDRLWAGTRAASLAGVNAGVLSSADNLLHVCAHAVSGRFLHWVPDARLILDRDPDLDWSAFLADAHAARLGLPLYAALQYLQHQMEVPVPSRVLESLRLAAKRTGLLGRSAARPWPDGPAWRRVFPPPIQFALHYDLRLWTVPFYYLYRIVRYVHGARSGPAARLR